MDPMTLAGRLLAAALVLVAGCTRPAPSPGPRRFPLTGQVVALAPAEGKVTVHHDDIPGFMDSMTMSFTVKEAAVLARLRPGDLLRATLVVGDERAWLEGVEKTGSRPLPPPSKRSEPADVDLLEPGAIVPDAAFIDQDGKAVKLSSLAGAPVVLTFIYTRCPLPDFCPLMDCRFGAVQAAAKAGRVKRPLRLVSVSFDPEFDTPAVLKAHAVVVGAAPDTWRFWTAERAAVEAFGARFGLSVLRQESDPGDITHNLRTALLDAGLRLVKIYDGNRWTSDEVVADLQALPAR